MLKAHLMATVYHSAWDSVTSLKNIFRKKNFVVAKMCQTVSNQLATNVGKKHCVNSLITQEHADQNTREKRCGI